MGRTAMMAAGAMLSGGCMVDGVSTTTQPIVGGQQTASDAFRATGMLVHGRSLRCTATLIAADVAITAAHCLDQSGFGDFGFSLDTDDSDGIADIVPVAFIHPHPDFHPDSERFTDLSQRNDIGVVILKDPIPDAAVELADTSSAPADVEPGAELTVCGYGSSIYPDPREAMTGIKRDARVTVDRTAAYELSTAAEGPQPCSGDSGGPLFADAPDGRKLVALVSRALGESSMCDSGAIVTRVAPYTAWIGEASRDRGCNADEPCAALVPILAELVQLGVLRRRRIRARA